MSELKKCPFCGGEARLKRFHLWHCAFCEYCGATGNVYGNTKENAVKNWNTRADGWISVKDRLPEEGEYVLVYAPELGGLHITIDSYRDVSFDGVKSKGWGKDAESYFYTKSRCIITHWQPLPEPPKGD